MAAVDDVWSSMKEDVAKDLQVQKLKNKKTLEIGSKVSRAGGAAGGSGGTGKVGGGGGKNDSIEAMVAREEETERVAKVKAKKKAKERKAAMTASLMASVSIVDKGGKKEKEKAVGNEESDILTPHISSSSSSSSSAVATPIPIDAKEVLLEIARHVSNMSNMDDQVARRKALQKIHDILFVKYVLSEDSYSEVFQDICRPIFRRFADPIEKCRELSFVITQKFFECAADLTLTIGYFVPAVMDRLPSTWAFDEEMKVFISDMENHEAYRRGKAVMRQDKNDLLSHTVVEPSEEIRLLACRTLYVLISRLCDMGAAAVLHPYFHEIIMYVQAQLRDPFPDLKAVACEVLAELSKCEEYAAGMKYFSVALCRAILPVMRHRHSKVRASAIVTLGLVMAVPDRAKQKGSGTDAIMDLVGFREENNLSVAAFYVSDVSVNYLAEAVQDNVIAVRLRTMEMLVVLLTEIGDRYDHQTRLLPYVLDLLCDEADQVSKLAMFCLQKCGQQYEEDHHDEIVERRQYGVDGDKRINVEKPLPHPFLNTGRPRLGMRLYVRGNCKRFLSALMTELTNWIGTTRLKSANLLRVVVIFMEEHLTMEAHTLLPSMIKALGFAAEDNDPALRRILMETYELVGRFILPEVYIHYLLPRLTGDATVVQFGVDTATRVTVLEFLSALLQGSKSREVAPLFEDLINALTDPFVISHESVKCMQASMLCMRVLLTGMVDRGKAAIEAHFLNTGRLTSLRGAVSKAFRWLVSSLSSPVLRFESSNCLVLLAQLDRDGIMTDTTSVSLDALFTLHGDALLAKMIDSLDCGSSEWTEASNITDRQTLSLLVGGPWFLSLCRTDGSRLEQLLTCICQCVCGTRGDYDAAYIGGAEHKTDILCYLADLLQASLLPLVKRRYCPTAELAAAFSMLPCSSPYTATGSNSSSRSWAGVCSTMSSENVETFRQLAHRKMSTLLEVFVVHSRWSTSRTLQTKRLQILCIMLDVNEEEGEEEGSTWGAIIRASDFISSFTLSPSSTALLDPNIFLSISTELPLRAGVPQLLRVLGIRATEALLNLLVHSFCQTDSAWDRRVKSLAYWAHQEQQQHEKHLVGLGTRPTTDFNVPQRSYVLRSVSVAVQRLLAALDDSSDTVRVHVLSALQMAAPVIGYATATTNVSGASGEENSSGRVVEARNGVSYLDICRRLLTSLVTDAQRSSSSGSSVATSNGDTDIEAVRCSIEATLRIYAMLDPSAMLPFLREAEQQLPPLNEDQKRFRASLPEAHEVLNALNDHCTLLVKFQKEL